MNYAISRTRDAELLYLQGVEPNEKYSNSATAPTMGDRHSYSEYRTIWGSTPMSFERMTASNYIKILFEEFRWKERTPFFFRVEPVLEGADRE